MSELWDCDGQDKTPEKFPENPAVGQTFYSYHYDKFFCFNGNEWQSMISLTKEEIEERERERLKIEEEISFRRLYER